MYKISRYISYLLRHHPESAGLSLDSNGWVDVEELIAAIRKNKKEDFSREDLEEIVRTDEKQRYAFNKDKTKIRASQGHSVNVDLELTSKKPPDILYHGTAEKYIDSIRREGVKPMSRMYVHLGTDREAAERNGKRHGIPIVLEVNANKMYEDGYKFYLSEREYETLSVNIIKGQIGPPVVE